MIDIKLFKKIYEEIDKKVKLIRVLPMLHNQEQDYDGWEYEEYNNKNVITVESSYYTSGCGEDTSSFEIPINEINNSIEWFREKFEKEIEDAKKKRDKIIYDEKERVKENRRLYKLRIEKQEMAIYNKIKKKLKNKNNEKGQSE